MLARPLAAVLLILGSAMDGRAEDMAAEIPACPLLTLAEVGDAFGEPVTATERPPMGGEAGRGRMTTCFWTPADGSPGATVSLAVWSWPPGHPGAAGFIAAFRDAQSPDRAPPETIALGDDAVWEADRLHVRKGQVDFTLAASLNALDIVPDARQPLEVLAGKVLDRLP